MRAIHTHREDLPQSLSLERVNVRNESEWRERRERWKGRDEREWSENVCGWRGSSERVKWREGRRE